MESFKSTLDEVREADVLLHVVDVSHPAFEDHIATVNATLEDIGARDKPTIMVFNKMDLYEERMFDPYLKEEIKKISLTNSSRPGCSAAMRMPCSSQPLRNAT